MAFMKTCFSCGKKSQRLYDSMCEQCLKEQFPPIQEIKPINFKIDNMSKKISFKNAYHNAKEIEKMLPDIVKRNIVINEHYVLKELEIENFEIIGHKMNFDVVVDCDIK